MTRNQLDVIIVRRTVPGKSKSELKVESVAQLFVGVQVLVAVLGKRDAVNLAHSGASVAAGQTTGSSGRGRCRLTADVAFTDTTTRLSFNCIVDLRYYRKIECVLLNSDSDYRGVLL